MPLPFLIPAAAVGTGAAIVVGLFRTTAAGVSDVGEAVNNTGAGLLKIALAASVSYAALRFARVV